LSTICVITVAGFLCLIRTVRYSGNDLYLNSQLRRNKCERASTFAAAVTNCLGSNSTINIECLLTWSVSWYQWGNPKLMSLVLNSTESLKIDQCWKKEKEILLHGSSKIGTSGLLPPGGDRVPAPSEAVQVSRGSKTGAAPDWSCWRGSWAGRQSSTLQPSPVVTNSGSWPKEWGCGYKFVCGNEFPS